MQTFRNSKQLKGRENVDMTKNRLNTRKRATSTSPEIIFKFVDELEGAEKQFCRVVQRFRCKHGKHNVAMVQRDLFP